MKTEKDDWAKIKKTEAELEFKSSYENEIKYFNEKNDIIPSNELRNIKYNLFMDKNNNLQILLSKKIFYTENNRDVFKIKKTGFLLTDTVTFIKDRKIDIALNIIDTITYSEVIVDKIYKDKNYIYVNKHSEYLDYPFYALDLIAKDTKFLTGYYIKDNNYVYSYRSLHITKLNRVNVMDFNVLKFKRHSDSVDYLGSDKYNLYYNANKVEYENLEYIVENKKLRDSLIQIYFPNEMK